MTNPDAVLKLAIDTVMHLATLACIPILLFLFVSLLKAREEKKWQPRKRA